MSKKIILAINSNMLHDSGAAVAIDGQLVAAVAEERLNRVKQAHGVPIKSVESVLEIAKVSPDKIDEIRIVGFPPIRKLFAFLY